MTLFSFFSSLSLIAGIMVIRAKNPVHSVLFLILVFCSMSGLLLLLGLDFFALIFLVVYVGAIAVLFLFVVMMLNIQLTEMNENILRYLPFGAIIAFIFFFEILFVIDSDLIPFIPTMNTWIFLPFLDSYVNWMNQIHHVSNIEGIAQLLYTHDVFYFMMAGIILLVAMIGAITLTMHLNIHVKRQDVFLQHAREFSTTVQKLKSFKEGERL